MGSSVLALMARIHFFPLVWLFFDKCLVIVWETQSHLKSWQSLSSSFASSVFPLNVILDFWWLKSFAKKNWKHRLLKCDFGFWMIKVVCQRNWMWFWIWIINVVFAKTLQTPSDIATRPQRKLLWQSQPWKGERELVEAASEKLFKLLLSLKWDLLKAPVTLRTTSNTLDWLRSFEKQLLKVIICQGIFLHITDIK